MADYDIKLNTNQLVDVLSKNDAIKGLLESVLNQVLASQMTEHLGYWLFMVLMKKAFVSRWICLWLIVSQRPAGVRSSND